MTKPARVEVSLVRLRTRDGVWLDGAVAEPSHRRAALIWVHGLGSVFSSGQVLIRELSSRLNAAGIGYFKFNNRGHDIVAGRGRHLAGAAFERFGQSVADIRTMIAFAATRGYSKIILAGHSTGANKVLYYAARVRDRRVTALVLLGPVSDIAAAAQQVGAQELRRRVAAAERLARRDPQALVPRAWGFERPALHQPVPSGRGRGRLPVLSAGRPVDGAPIGATPHGGDHRKSRRVPRSAASGADRHVSAERRAGSVVHRRGAPGRPARF